MKKLRPIMTGYAACTDHPALFCLPELMEMYPDAKVVLTTREPERWWQSLRHVLEAGTAGWAMILPLLTPGWATSDPPLGLSWKMG
jgi:hypothetical protein